MQQQQQQQQSSHSHPHSPSDTTKQPSHSHSHQSNKSEHRRCSDTSHKRPSLFSNSAAGIPPSARSLSQDSLTPARKPVEAAVWDWEVPGSAIPEPAGTAAAAGLFYEPQGELLNERTGRDLSSKEFSIPDPVPVLSTVSGSGPASAAPGPSNPLESLLSGGVKRKAAPDSDRAGSSAGLERQTHKRLMLSMGEESSAARDPRQRERGERRTLPVDSSASASSASTSTSLALPARKVFPIQIGDKLFRLSGASISSDAPSYFSQFFSEQLLHEESADSVRTLYIDRDPATFEDISLHLQGYHVAPRDGEHFVKLFADAQFFSLPRLTNRLFTSPIYTTIGGRAFQIPRDLFATPGNSPNYFTLGFQTFFTTPSDAFPGLSQRTLLRPPSILPPEVPNRSADIFADLLDVLKGYPVAVRGDEHRAALVRDARYFHLKGVEQRLLKCRVARNLRMGREEIEIGLGDLRQSGVSFVADGKEEEREDEEDGMGDVDDDDDDDESSRSTDAALSGSVFYSRPYVDDSAYALILEIGGEESVELQFSHWKVGGEGGGGGGEGRVKFHQQTLARMVSLVNLVASKMDLPCDVEVIGVGERDDLSAVVGEEADVVVDGVRWYASGEGLRKEAGCRGWVLKRSQWRVKCRAKGGRGDGKGGVEVYLEAVRVEAFSCERARNEGRGFL